MPIPNHSGAIPGETGEGVLVGFRRGPGAGVRDDSRVVTEWVRRARCERDNEIGRDARELF
ncbi:hypothetical protein [Rhodococcus sp. ABRD24]|uniref:hypothetical protein n=1 Tax=Rhodococcus sp. ABRD24 TaxID=2507582 RepID=UPI001F61B58C|nr:hypothetical protein [Rhodococcus sp. ABRD24]